MEFYFFTCYIIISIVMWKIVSCEHFVKLFGDVLFSTKTFLQNLHFTSEWIRWSVKIWKLLIVIINLLIFKKTIEPFSCLEIFSWFSWRVSFHGFLDEYLFMVILELWYVCDYMGIWFATKYLGLDFSFLIFGIVNLWSLDSWRAFFKRTNMLHH